MKSLLTFIFVSILSFSSIAQNTLTSNKYKIAFETTELLEQYETKAETVLGYENNNYAVDIEIFSVDEQPQSFIDSQKQGAVNTAKSLGLKEATFGERVNKIPGAYYALAYEIYESERNPVYVIAALNKKLGITYEATVYCYSKHLEEGKKIAKSFRLLD